MSARLAWTRFSPHDKFSHTHTSFIRSRAPLSLSFVVCTTRSNTFIKGIVWHTLLNAHNQKRKFNNNWTFKNNKDLVFQGTTYISKVLRTGQPLSVVLRLFVSTKICRSFVTKTMHHAPRRIDSRPKNPRSEYDVDKIEDNCSNLSYPERKDHVTVTYGNGDWGLYGVSIVGNLL